MASYKGNYVTDFMYEVSGALLPVYLVENGNKLNTSVDFDSSYLTPTFLNHVQVISGNVKGCNIPVKLTRKLILNLGVERDLYVTMPFIGTNIDHIDFLREINALNNINFFRLSGEISEGMIDFYVRNN